MGSNQNILLPNEGNLYWRIRRVAPINSKGLARFWPTMISSAGRNLTVQYEDWLVDKLNYTVIRIQNTATVDIDIFGYNITQIGIVHIFF